MIPKIIHYCWFGRNPLPQSAIKCIHSWKKFFPDYEIKEWNEDNFDVNIISYTAEAYEAKKYAFVSDYARMWVLYNYGGIYFDTDVEVIKPMKDIVENGPFMGIESESEHKSIVNPGLGLGFDKNNQICKKIVDLYHQSNLECKGYIVPFATKVLQELELKKSNKVQTLDGITIYPTEYFNPYNNLKGKLNITPNTRTIHWFDASWLSSWGKIKYQLGKFFRKILN